MIHPASASTSRSCERKAGGSASHYLNKASRLDERDRLSRRHVWEVGTWDRVSRAFTSKARSCALTAL